MLGLLKNFFAKLLEDQIDSASFGQIEYNLSPSHWVWPNLLNSLILVPWNADFQIKKRNEAEWKGEINTKENKKKPQKIFASSK